jgi:hypothetical protein
MANVDNLPYISPAEIPTAIAAAAVSSRRFVKIAPGGVGNRPKVIHAAAATDVPFGVSMTDALLGKDVGVWRAGVVPVEAGAALTAGALVGPDGTGKAIAATGTSVWGVVTADCASGDSAPVALMIG